MIVVDTVPVSCRACSKVEVATTRVPLSQPRQAQTMAALPDPKGVKSLRPPALEAEHQQRLQLTRVMVVPIAV
jgi:hypothetical protein